MTNEGKYITYTKKSITEKGLKNSSAWLVPEKSLLYSMYASVGFVSINNIPLTTSQAIFNIIFKEQISLEFMYYYLTFYKRYSHKYIETGTQGNLNAKLIKNVKTNSIIANTVIKPEDIEYLKNQVNQRIP